MKYSQKLPLAFRGRDERRGVLLPGSILETDRPVALQLVKFLVEVELGSRPKSAFIFQSTEI